jgi:hypothetical protein
MVVRGVVMPSSLDVLNSMPRSMAKAFIMTIACWSPAK